MLAWILSLVQRAWAYLGASVNPSDRTTEIRLIAFGIFVTLATILIWVEFWQTLPHHINNTALATLAGTCSLGALSMRGGQ